MALDEKPTLSAYSIGYHSRNDMAKHDPSYKRLFSHPEMVRDLLQGFVPEPWVGQLDFTTLEKMNNSYVTDDLREREDDIIWRLRYRENWVYVYLLLEFQSTVDCYMAVRILTYVGLLYQDLIKSGRIEPGDKLPPVIPPGGCPRIAIVARASLIVADFSII